MDDTDDKERRSAFMSAIVTEHFVLQTAANATVSESGTRASLFILALSSALVAMGFASQSREVFEQFVATVLAGVLLGDDRRGLALGLGAVAAVAAMAAFFAFQRWRYSTW